jgi:N-methylhydantoinase B
VVDAGQKLIDDAERLARDRLRAIPDGTWKARSYGTLPNRTTGGADPYRIVATLTKRGDELEIDFNGSSDQAPNDMNSTLPNTMAHVAIALTNTVFWNVPWSDGKLLPVSVKVREGSILHCRYPAACSHGPRIGTAVVAALGECIAKMLFAAGETDDVNASWAAHWTAGGPGYFYGGHNREGLPIAQGLYDIHGSGLGAAPSRDGVNSGGHMNIPSGGISDVERIEMQYPFLYFTRNHPRDGGGFGKRQGGAGTYRIYMIHGSSDVSVEYKPYGGVPEFSFGLFGGYPVGYGADRVMFATPPDIGERLAREPYPTRVDDVDTGGWGERRIPQGAPPRVPVPEGSILTDFVFSGGGFGDPLERDPELVAADLRHALVSPRTADLVYGVVLAADGSVDADATDARRSAIRDERRSVSKAPEQTAADGGDWQPVLRFHEYLELVRDGERFAIRCRCGRVLCDARENYKQHAMQRRRSLAEFSGKPLPSGSEYQAVYEEYACPACATLLAVDVVAEPGEPEPLWDIRIDLDQFAATRAATA